MHIEFIPPRIFKRPFLLPLSPGNDARLAYPLTYLGASVMYGVMTAGSLQRLFNHADRVVGGGSCLSEPYLALGALQLA